uniref:Stress-associated endoplasmic reticulum protein n=1 Tax=Brassica oleracea var. oleracea TaxID=109376 RepID=A0A0D3D6H1_BRAOL
KTYNSNKYISSWENKNKTKKCFFFSLQLDRDHSVFFSGAIMTTSKRLADRKIEKFDKNITKRGFVPETTTKKGKDYPVGPILLGFFVFVVIGSSLFQIIRTATSGGMA